MARNLFGGSSDDYAADTSGRPLPNRRIRFYTSAAMTTEITDLASDAAGTGAPLAVSTDSHGFWGPVYGPDAVTVMYAGAADGAGNPPAYVVAVYTHSPPAGGVSTFNGRAGAVSLSKADVTGTALAAADVGAQNVVVHGSTAGTARPAGATLVQWVGSVAPTNAATNDEWTDTTSKLLKRWNGSSFDALGSAASSALVDQGTWVTSHAYAVGDVVTFSGARYACKTAHTSGTFTTDVATKWTLTGYLTPVVTTPMEGLQALLYGHSYSQGTGASNNYGYAQRLNRRFDWQNVFNRSQSATTSHQESMVEPVNDYNNFIKAQGFLVAMDSVINDAADGETVAYGGTLGGPAPAAAVAKMTNMKAHLIACIRRGGAEITDASGTYTGTWTTNSGDAESLNYANGAASTSHSTTTQNDFVTFTGLTAGAKYAVLLQGIDNTKFGTNGAAFTISTPGGTLVTGTTSNQFYQGRDTMARSVMPVIITMPVGQTSLTITKTDATGPKLYVNGILPQLAAGQSNFTLIMKAPYVVTVANGTVDQMNAAIDAAVTAHGNGGEVIVCDPNALGWDKTTMLRPDGLHPNDKGHAFLADAYFNAALTATYGPQRNLYTT